MGKTVDEEQIARERERLGEFPAKWLAFCGEPIDADSVQLAASRPLQRGRALEIICRAIPHVHCGPDLLTLLDPESDIESGEVHPNGAGHDKIAGALERAISDLRRQASR